MESIRKIWYKKNEFFKSKAAINMMPKTDAYRSKSARIVL